MNFGLPYMGSKNRIAKKIIDLLPAAETFVDLMAGGCAMTHAAMLSGKYKRYIANDLTNSALIFQRAINGEFRHEKRWISREDFFLLKDTDPYVRLCYSFGSDQRTYCYSRTIEPYKHACHLAIVDDSWDELARLCPEIVDTTRQALDGLLDIHRRRLAFGPAVVAELKRRDWDLVQNNALYKSCHWRRPTDKNKHVDLESLPSLEHLERLQSLESLQSLERLQNLERLERLQSLESPYLTCLQGDYREVVIPAGAVVYCDPPYQHTKKYLHDFDHKSFFAWARGKGYYISEYAAPFSCIAEMPSRSCFSATNNNKKVMERIYLT